MGLKIHLSYLTSVFNCNLRYTESVFLAVRLVNACWHLDLNYSSIMFTHTQASALTPDSLNMATWEMSVKTWE